jgi:transcriptional regulator with XRE-family HTH domain
MRQLKDIPLIEGVGQRIRALRTERGLSLREFGKQADVHPFHVMAIELGQIATNTETLRSIAIALDVAPMDLLNHNAHEEDNDLGAILELMRTRPETIQTVREYATCRCIN